MALGSIGTAPAPVARVSLAIAWHTSVAVGSQDCLHLAEFVGRLSGCGLSDDVLHDPGGVATVLVS